ncbi:MAG: sulfite exporter TauE/SafE family protein [Planctomycetes bacterium]|nr:sulfite exporter TauE/SafE family protein [Planctomycetota bacterium]MCB9905783.1 sulfite exporter TauE/SafE family protein [Planctomycetota bacterium]
MSTATESATTTAEEHAAASAPAPNKGMLFGFGLLISIWGAMCGIGGGLFTVPFLHFVLKFPMRRAVATSLGLVFAATSSATIAETFHSDSRIHWPLAGTLIVGSLIGAQLGFRVAKRIDTRRLKLLFAVALLFVGVRILVFAGNGSAVADASFVIENKHLGAGFLIGIGGGFLAPIMGIGGGLVAVPALTFGIPSLGHLGARASSMAMATVTSARSFWMYLKTREAVLSEVVAIGGGAAIGSMLGVQLVHLEGMAGVARAMMGVTLLLVAGRFAWDLRPGSACRD